MTREIKFRAWHFGQKKMYGADEMAMDQLTLLTTGQFISVDGVSTRLSVIVPLDKMAPLQFTGLTDKNGKEIYEGDVVKAKGYANPEAVEYITSGFKVGGMLGHALSYWRKEKIEVVGNIYESQALLTKEPNA